MCIVYTHTSEIYCMYNAYMTHWYFSRPKQEGKGTVQSELCQSLYFAWAALLEEKTSITWKLELELNALLPVGQVTFWHQQCHNLNLWINGEIALAWFLCWLDFRSWTLNASVLSSRQVCASELFVDVMTIPKDYQCINRMNRQT